LCRRDLLHKCKPNFGLSNPDLTLVQIKSWLADQYGLKFCEVGRVFGRLRTIYAKAQREGLEARNMRNRG
jgi:hypothetical protein